MRGFSQPLLRDCRPQRAVLTKHSIEMCTRDRRPAAFFANLSERFGVAREKIINRLLSRINDVAQRMNADFELVGCMSRAPSIFPIDVNERTEPPRLATNDSDHQRKA